MKWQEKSIIMIAVIGLMALLCSCDVYSGGIKTDGNFTYRFDEGKKRAMVSSWHWDGDPENTVIEIQNEVDSAEIDALGGATGTNAPIDPFEIVTDYEVKFQFSGPNPEAYGGNVTFEDIVFTLKIGKNVKSVRTSYTNRDDDLRNYAPIQKEDGTWIFYRIYFNVVCDDENQTLYAENGKLEKKRGTRTIDLLPYLKNESETTE